VRSGLARERGTRFWGTHTCWAGGIASVLVEQKRQGHLCCGRGGVGAVGDDVTIASGGQERWAGRGARDGGHQAVAENRTWVWTFVRVSDVGVVHRGGQIQEVVGLPLSTGVVVVLLWREGRRRCVRVGGRLTITELVGRRCRDDQRGHCERGGVGKDVGRLVDQMGEVVVDVVVVDVAAVYVGRDAEERGGTDVLWVERR